MKKIIGKINILTSLLIIINVGITYVFSQNGGSSNYLTRDLVYRTRLPTEDSESLIESIILVDANTLQATPIYQNDMVDELRPLAWSPDGNLLAVAQIYYYTAIDAPYQPASDAQLCLVSMVSNPVICFDDHLSYYYMASPETSLEQYKISWSPDGSKIYFVTEYDKTKQLIEADVATGKTIRALYETNSFNKDDVPSIVAWSPQLNNVLDGIGLVDRTGILVNLETGKTLDLSALVTPWSGSRGEMPQGSGFVCPEFSPKGTYLTAIDEAAGQILIADTELNILDRVGHLGINGFTRLHCPVWDSDEHTLYIHAANPNTGQISLFTYVLSERKLELHSQDTVYFPFKVSPDGAGIAFEGSYTVNVLLPSGVILQFGTPPIYSSNPLWRPLSRP